LRSAHPPAPATSRAEDGLPASGPHIRRSASQRSASKAGDGAITVACILDERRHDDVARLDLGEILELETEDKGRADGDEDLHQYPCRRVGCAGARPGSPPPPLIPAKPFTAVGMIRVEF
jgi:hypothetical protein